MWAPRAEAPQTHLRTNRLCCPVQIKATHKGTGPATPKPAHTEKPIPKPAWTLTMALGTARVWPLLLLKHGAPFSSQPCPHRWGPYYLDLLVTGLSSKSHSCVGGGTAANWQSNMASSFLVTMRSCGTITA